MKLWPSNCCRHSPILWKTAINLPYSLVTYHRGFQDKTPSAIHHSSHTSSSITLHISVPFLVPLRPFWHGRTRTVHSVQDADAPLWAYTAGTRGFVPLLMSTTAELSFSQGASYLQSIAPADSKCHPSRCKLKCSKHPLSLSIYQHWILCRTYRNHLHHRKSQKSRGGKD